LATGLGNLAKNLAQPVVRLGKQVRTGINDILKLKETIMRNLNVLVIYGASLLPVPRA
jgi:hypothetical protein